jgi:two-component system chemotaxis response regulator CheB
MLLKILVADDSALFRRMVCKVLETPDVEIIGTASNGKSAVAKILELKPDLVILDIDMPEMNGLQVLEALRDHTCPPGVLVLSAMNREGSRLTIRALELGAFDFVAKPNAANAEESIKILREALLSRIRAFSQRREIRQILYGSSGTAPETPGTKAATPAPLRGGKPTIVAIGISTGGPNALGVLLPQLPADLNVPVVIVQHMPAFFIESLAAALGTKCRLQVKVALDGDRLLANVIYLAPGDRQMKIIVSSSGEKKIGITDDLPEKNCRPSVDYLFRSVATQFGKQALAVIMTGMGNDGTDGLQAIKQQGGSVLAQDEATCVVFGMPKEAIGAGVVDQIVPLDRLAGMIVRLVQSPACP